MAEGEFSLIDHYFRYPAERSLNLHSAQDFVLGIGDDAAVMQVPSDQLLVQTIDTLIAGVHFPQSTPIEDIAYKCLAVNVSDLAAMAARPWTFVLSLTLPEKDEEFLNAFSASLFSAAEQFGIALVGGDTCKGPLSVTIQANGLVAKDQFVTRQGAGPGDYILLSGRVGSAALGLASINNEIKLNDNEQIECQLALNRPRPRIDLISLLSGFASAAIDISDGLVSDLGHILKQSGVGAVINKQALPVPRWISQSQQYQYALSGGDDYQLVFTVREADYSAVMEQIRQQALDVCEIGRITEDHAFMLFDNDALVDLHQYRGFNHFGS